MRRINISLAITGRFRDMALWGKHFFKQGFSLRIIDGWMHIVGLTDETGAMGDLWFR